MIFRAEEATYEESMALFRKMNEAIDLLRDRMNMDSTPARIQDVLMQQGIVTTYVEVPDGAYVFSIVRG